MHVARQILIAALVATVLPLEAPAAVVASQTTPTSEFAYEVPVGFYARSVAGYSAVIGAHDIDPAFPNRDRLTSFEGMWWDVTLEGPDGAAITPGTYTGARSVANAAASEPIFSPMTASGMCPDPVTTFIVNAVARDSTGMLTMLDLSFDLVCEGVASHAVGELRYRTEANPISVLVNSPLGLNLDDWAKPYGHIPIGTTGAARAFTFTAAGRAGSIVGTPSVGGAHPDDFTITTDTCGGATLFQGETCTIAVAFSPTAGGLRTADLVVPSNADTGARRIALGAEATTPTTTTIALLNNPAYGSGSKQATITVTPSPGGGSAGVKYWHNGYWDYSYGLLNANGVAVVTAYGSGEIYGYFPEQGLFESSISQPVIQLTGAASTVSLTSAVNPQEATKPVALTATVLLADGAGVPAAGVLEIVDETANEVLARKDVAAGSTLTFAGLLPLGDHAIKATYSGATLPSLVGPSSATLTQHVGPDQKVDATGLKLTYATFYPVVDGYRDTVAIRGTLGEPASISVRIVSAGTGKTVRSITLGSKPVGAYSWSWNGRSDTGSLQPSGSYRVTQTVTDLVGNKVTATQPVTLSKRTVVWKSATVTKNAERYSYYGGTGLVSKSKSAYSSGAYLAAYGDGEWEAAIYIFTAPTALAYRTVSFKVRGRSRSVPKAWIALWNPALGSSLNLGSYDRWARAGTAYGTYGVSGTGATHQKSRSVRGLLYVETEAGTPAIFDAAKVYMRVSYAVWP